MSFDRCALAASIVIDASDAETAALVAAARRPELADSPLWRALERVDAPGLDAPLVEVVAWCGRQIGARRDAVALGAVVGAICEAYLVRGWAVAAATVAAGDAATRLPDFDALADEVAACARARFVGETGDDVAARPAERDVLVEIGAAPPGGDLVRGALAKLIEAVGELEPAPGPTCAAQIAATFDRAAAALELPASPDPSTGIVELGDVVACLHDAGSAAWTWDELDTWQFGDPFLYAKAVARGLGAAPLVDVLEDARMKIADLVGKLLDVAWRTEVLAVRGHALEETPSPLAAAIVELASDAAVIAARRVAAAARARWTGAPGEDVRALCAELLGDPRDCPPLWEPSAPAIRALLEAPR
jgi:hypothetical protein